MTPIAPRLYLLRHAGADVEFRDVLQSQVESSSLVDKFPRRQSQIVDRGGCVEG